MSLNNDREDWDSYAETMERKLFSIKELIKEFKHRQKIGIAEGDEPYYYIDMIERETR